MSATNSSPGKELFERAAEQLNIPSFMLEKDWHVTQVLAFLSQLNHPGFEIVFSGGTALSKAHGLIQRFSEDIDFRVIAASRAPGRSLLSGFKKAVVEALRRANFHIEDESIRARDSNRFFSFDIGYGTHFARASGLRRHIQVEVTVHDPQLPVMRLPVHSFMSRLMMNPPEVGCIACVSPVESAADKLSAIAWRIPDRVRGDQHDDPAMVRHLHDLAALESLAEKDPRFPGLVLASLCRDSTRPRNNSSFAALSVAEKFSQMLDILATDAEYLKEYDLFVRGVSYASEGLTPDFTMATQAVTRLVERVLVEAGSGESHRDRIL